MSPPLRLAIIGAGIMGTNHARVARQLRGAELTAVVDRDEARALAAAQATGALALGSLDDVLGEIDLAVVAVPTAQHVETCLALADAGVHMLVEKPIAGTPDDARRILDAAEHARLMVAVGHIERFNAAVAELPPLLDQPLHIEASRISPYSPRISDGVIFDLMIHDLDIVQWLAGADASVESVEGVARSVRGASEDLASATIAFSTGLTATFNTSRLGQQKIRMIEVTQHDSVINADLVRQDVTVHRMSRHEYLADEGQRYRQSSVIEIPFIEQRGEPLLRELQSVVDNVLHQTAPVVAGEDGLRAVGLAERVAASVRRS